MRRQVRTRPLPSRSRSGNLHTRRNRASGTAPSTENIAALNDPNIQEQARHFDAVTPLNPWPQVLRSTGLRYSYTAKDALIARALGDARLSLNSLVLDIGSGVGIWLDRIGASFGTRAIGIDISFESLRAAKALSRPGSCFVLADARRLPFQSGCFDLTLSLDVLEHIVSPDLVINEMVRVSNFNGFLLTYAVSRNRRFTLEWIQERILALVGVDLLAFSCHKRELLVDPEVTRTTLLRLGLHLARFEFFHSFVASMFDQPQLVGNLALKKAGVFKTGVRIQTIVGTPALAISTFVSRRFLHLLEQLDRPWTTRGHSNGFLVLAQRRKGE